jgi:hypothetical protein
MSNAFGWRRAAALFVVAGIAAILALTSGRWLPEVPRLLGIAQANRESIGILADVVQVLDTVVRWLLWGAAALLVYLGFKKLGTVEGSGRTTAADVAPGGRGVGIGGHVDRSEEVAAGRGATPPYRPPPTPAPCVGLSLSRPRRSRPPPRSASGW